MTHHYFKVFWQASVIALLFFMSMSTHAEAIDSHVNHRLCATCHDVYEKLRETETEYKEIETRLNAAKQELVEHFKQHGSPEQMAEENMQTKDAIELTEQKLREEMRYFKRPKTFMDTVKSFFGVQIRNSEFRNIEKLQKQIAKLENELKTYRIVYARQQELAMQITDLRNELKSSQSKMRNAQRHIDLCKKYNCFLVEADNYDQVMNTGISGLQQSIQVVRTDKSKGAQCLSALVKPPGAKMDANLLCKKLDVHYRYGCCNMFGQYYKAIRDYSKITNKLGPYQDSEYRQNYCLHACNYYYETWAIKDYMARAKTKAATYDLHKKILTLESSLQNLSDKMADFQAQLEQRGITDEARQDLETRQGKVREAMLPMIQQKSNLQFEAKRIEQNAPPICPAYDMNHKRQICFTYCREKHLEIDLNKQVEVMMDCSSLDAGQDY